MQYEGLRGLYGSGIESNEGARTKFRTSSGTKSGNGLSPPSRREDESHVIHRCVYLMELEIRKNLGKKYISMEWRDGTEMMSNPPEVG